MKAAHFDAVDLLKAVHDQPIGLACTTNNPQGFRRLVYLASRQRQDLKVQILQSPDSADMFYVVKADVDINSVIQEEPE